jgi:hypothetical protein
VRARSDDTGPARGDRARVPVPRAAFALARLPPERIARGAPGHVYGL